MTAPTASDGANDPPAQLSARAVLRIPDYRRLWAAQGISDIGDALTQLTLLIVVLRITNSTAALAVMAIALAVPAIVVGPIAGVFVDRWDRRRVMLASDILRAGLVLLFILGASNDRLPLLYAIAIAHSAIGTFFTPARMALIPRVVSGEGLMAANSLSQMTRVLASVGGSALAGLIVGIADVTWPAFTIDALTFVASFALVLRVRIDGRPAPHPDGSTAHGGVFASMRHGLALVARSPLLLGTMIGAGVTMLGLGAVNILFVPLMINDLKVPATWLGAVDGAQTLSMILAAGLVAVIAARLRPTTIIVIGLAGIAVSIGLVAGVSNVWQVVVLLFIVGWFVTPLEASLATIVQTSTADQERGRVASTLHAVMSAASVLSMALAGVFADVLSIRAVFLLAGVVVAVAAIAAFVMFRRAPAAKPAAASSTAQRQPSTTMTDLAT